MGRGLQGPGRPGRRRRGQVQARGQVQGAPSRAEQTVRELGERSERQAPIKSWAAGCQDYLKHIAQIKTDFKDVLETVGDASKPSGSTPMFGGWAASPRDPDEGQSLWRGKRRRQRQKPPRLVCSAGSARPPPPRPRRLRRNLRCSRTRRATPSAVARRPQRRAFSARPALRRPRSVGSEGSAGRPSP